MFRKQKENLNIRICELMAQMGWWFYEQWAMTTINNYIMISNGQRQRQRQRQHDKDKTIEDDCLYI